MTTHKTLHFLRHYAEMVVAMLLGMTVFVLVADPASTELELIGMAAAMTVPMVAWMRHRGHGWAASGEMTAAMVVPTVAALMLLWTGVAEDEHALLMIQHIAMFPLMLAVMLLRPREYGAA